MLTEPSKIELYREGLRNSAKANEAELLKVKPIHQNTAVNSDTTNERSNKLSSMLAEARIRPEDEYDKPQTCLEVIEGSNTATIATLGNFSMIIGKAKSRKTFYVSIAVAAAVKNLVIMERFIGNLPENKNAVLLFDTEQGKHHVHKVVKRITKLSGIESPPNLYTYSLRKHSPAERREIIQHAIYNTPNVGLVVIDGIRDLVTSINDEAEATGIASDLLRWTEEKNIHIITVLHQNKGDDKARGHIGTELVNKAETVLSVAKDSDSEDRISVVTCTQCREKDFKPFAFEIDENGLPVLVPDWANKENHGNATRSLSPIDVPDETHKQMLAAAFKDNPKMKYSEVHMYLKLQYDTHTKMGENKIKLFMTYALSKKFLLKEGTPGTKSCFYYLPTGLTDQPELV